MPKSAPPSLREAGGDHPGRSLRRHESPFRGRGLVGPTCFLPRSACVTSRLNTIGGEMVHSLECKRSCWPLMPRYRTCPFVRPPTSHKRPNDKALSPEPAEGWGRGRHWAAYLRGLLSKGWNSLPSPSESCQTPSLSGRPRARWSSWASRTPWTPRGPGPSWRHWERWPQGSTRPSGKRT